MAPLQWLKTVQLSVERVLPALLATFLCLLVAWRTRFGIDFTDESFYAAMPYRFSQGLAPFRDERAIHQMASLLVYPFVLLHQSVVGSIDGLILKIRYLSLAMAMGTAVIAFFALKTERRDLRATLAVLLLVAFVPANIRSLSYNTEAIAAFSGAFFLSFARTKTLSFVVPGLLVAAAFCNPAFLVPGAALLIFQGPLVHDSANKFKAELTAFLVLCSSIVVAGILVWNDLKLALDFTISTGSKAGGVRKLYFVLRGLAENMPGLLAFYLLIIASIGLRSAKNEVLRALSLVTVSASLFLVALGILLVPAPYPLGHLAIAAPLLALERHRSGLRRILAYTGIPLLAGLLVAYVSADGAYNFVVGAMPCGVLSLWFAQTIMPQLSSRLRVLRILPTTATLLILAALTNWHVQGVYRDRPMSELNVVVSDGPFAGLFTTESRASFLRRLSVDLASVSQPGSKVIFYHHFPAGFLLSDLPPGICTSWVVDYGDTSEAYSRQYRECIQRMADRRTLIVRMKRRFDVSDISLDTVRMDPITSIISECSPQLLLDRPEYSISVAPSGCADTRT